MLISTPVFNKASLLQQLYSHSSEIKSFGVMNLGLFGSFAKDKMHADSDIDFLVDFEQDKKNYDNFVDLSFYLESLLGRKIELVTKQSLSKYIGPHILKQVEHVAL